MSSSDHNRWTQPYTQNYDSQAMNTMLHLGNGDEEDWTSYLQSQATESPSTYLDQAQPLMNAQSFLPYNEHSAQRKLTDAYDNHEEGTHHLLDIQAAFMASQGYIDENTPREYYAMTPEDYQQLIDNYNTSGYLIPAPLSHGSVSQQGLNAMTGNYTAQVFQAPEHSAGLQGIENDFSLQRYHYQSPDFAPPQGPYYPPHTTYNGYYQPNNPRQPVHPLIRESTQAPSLTFIEYPSPPGTSPRTTITPAQHTTIDTPTKKASKSSPKPRKKQSKTSKKYQDRKTLQCDECSVKATCASNLAQHKLTHNGDKDYHCEMEGCGKSFHRPWGLGRHYRDVHGMKDVKVKKLDGVRNPSPRKPARDRKNSFSSGSPVPQKPLPQFVSSLPNFGHGPPDATSLSVSVGELSSTGCSDSNSTAPSPRSLAPPLSITCMDCGCPCTTITDLACHGHTVHNDPYSDHCSCVMCWGHRRDQEQQQQPLSQQEQYGSGFAIVDMYAQLQAQAQTQTQAAHHGDVDMDVEFEDSNSPRDVTPTTQASLSARDSPMPSTPSTDVDTKMQSEDYVYPPPTPTIPWSPFTITADVNFDPNTSINDVDAKPNHGSSILDPFALDIEMDEMNAFLADSEPFPMDSAPSHSQYDFYPIEQKCVNTKDFVG